MREVVEKIVRGYFQGLEEGMRKKMSFLNSDKSEMVEKLERTETIVHELENLRKALEVPKGFIDTVEKVLRLDSNKLVDSMSESYGKIKEMRKEFEIQVSIDKSFTESLQGLLAKSVFLGSGKEYYSKYEGENIKTFMKDSPSRSSSQKEFFGGESQSQGSRWVNPGVKSKKMVEGDGLRTNSMMMFRKEPSDAGSEKKMSRRRSSDSQNNSVTSSKSRTKYINVIGLNTFKE